MMMTDMEIRELLKNWYLYYWVHPKSAELHRRILILYAHKKSAAYIASEIGYEDPRSVKAVLKQLESFVKSETYEDLKVMCVGYCRTPFLLINYKNCWHWRPWLPMGLVQLCCEGITSVPEMVLHSVYKELKRNDRRKKILAAFEDITVCFIHEDDEHVKLFQYFLYEEDTKSYRFLMNDEVARKIEMINECGGDYAKTL